MNQFANYLQQHLDGEVLTSDDVRDYFATDASVLAIKPKIVIYPRHEVDIRKVLLWCDQFANKGLIMPVTSRGGGSDLTGAAIGRGVVMVFTAHMNKLLEFERRKGYCRLQPGCPNSQWQQFLAAQQRFFPPTKGGDPQATIGGAVANNSGGYYSHKYGLTGDYISRLRVVLSNGEIITAGPLSRRQTLKKVYQSTLEGEIYRKLIQLWPRYEARLQSWPQAGQIGYNLRNVRQDDGGYNLIPLFVGSQGTLGIISQVEAASRPFNPVPLSVILPLKKIKDLPPLVAEIKKQRPASLEMIDGESLRRVSQISKAFFDDYSFEVSNLAAVLLVEFDNPSYRRAWSSLKKVVKKAEYYGVDCAVMSTNIKQQQFDRLREATSFIITDSSRQSRHLPGFEDAYIPLDQFLDFYKKAKELFKRQRINLLVWGNIGLGQVKVWPKINLGEATGRNRYFNLLEDYWQLVTKFGGQASCLHNDGQIRGPNIIQQVPEDIYQIMAEVKNIFDPFGILNPQVKLGASRKQNSDNLKSDYNWGRFYQNWPRG